MKLTTLVFAFLPLFLIAQSKNRGSVIHKKDVHVKNGYTIQWNTPKIKKQQSEEKIQFLNFDGCVYRQSEIIPEVQVMKKLRDFPARIKVTMANAIFQLMNDKEIQIISKSPLITDQIKITSRVSYLKGKAYGVIWFIPIRKNRRTGAYEKLVSYSLNIQAEDIKTIPPGKVRNYAQNSVLAAGNWYKIGLTKDGIYKLDYDFLESIGLNMLVVDPRNIRIYGNGGGMLPYDNSVFRYDDLAENTIYVEGESDGIFDTNDYVLFYGQGTTRWKLNGSYYNHIINQYSDTTYYFITADLGMGKRVNLQNSLPTYNITVNSFDDLQYYDKDQTNLIKTGRDWFGESFNIVTSANFIMTFPNIDLNSNAHVVARLASRTIGASSNFTVDVSGQANSSDGFGPVTEGYTDQYAIQKNIVLDFIPNNSTFNIDISYNKGNNSAIGWLNYIEANVRRKLILAGDQMIFRDALSVGLGNVARYQILGVDVNTQIWDVTYPTNIKNLQGNLLGNTFSFNANADTLHRYIAFTGNSFYKPVFIEKVNNQNLHAYSLANMLIVTNPRLKDAAEELADFHRTHDQLTVHVVSTKQIYNEFSSGSRDITAIKDFVKMFYDRAAGDSTKLPRYLCLFGDGSYDNKHRLTGNVNLIPTYESSESLLPTTSYVSDDYYGLLDNNESDNPAEIIDIGIGRLPVRSLAEALDIVKKIKYYSNIQTMKPWRNWLAFVGDDEDNALHMTQSDQLAQKVDSLYPDYNIDKIYLDSYNQVSTPGGERYPDVNEAINKRMEQGCLILTYVGHGGELGWAHERVLEVSDINSWTNIDNMPLFLTATCEFSRWDDPLRTSAGEYCFLNKNGGAIALLTTTRLVYSNPNKQLADTFFNYAFSELNGDVIRLGDLMLLTKINGPLIANTRNFTLIGDPAVQLAYPRYNVITSSMQDTIKALSKVTVTGYIVDPGTGQKINNYNGVVYPIVFDKKMDILTLNNDGQGAFSYKDQNNMLFKGKASVNNGDFNFTFIVPKDIAYKYGNGKISYYVKNGSVDGNGYYDNFIIGGTDSNAPEDNSGPDIKLYLNDSTFVFGGITDENPDIYAKLYDENGINTVGSGLGHDITAVLDDNTMNAQILNEYYESDLNSYQKGSVRYPLSNLEEGYHTLRLKAWDVYNNSGEAYTQFIVAKNAKLALDHVLNYPNPFTTSTDFYFEHNRPGENLDIKIRIFTISGKLIKTIRTFSFTDGYRIGPIHWDGLDEFGDKIGRGVYIYNVKITTPVGEVVDVYEKLVLLN